MMDWRPKPADSFRHFGNFRKRGKVRVGIGGVEVLNFLTAIALEHPEQLEPLERAAAPRSVEPLNF